MPLHAAAGRWLTGCRTDLRTNYQPVLADLRRLQLSDLFLATDNAKVVAEARAVLAGTAVHSFARLPAGDRPLHVGVHHQLAEERNTDAILDLLLLALSSRLFVTETTRSGIPMSGFSKLARNLNRERLVLLGLLDRPDIHAIVKIA